METRTIRNRVRRGVAFLNERRPSWINSISIERLELARCDLCVLGQIYGTGHDSEGRWIDGYSRGLEVLNGKVQENPIKYGFLIDSKYNSKEYCFQLNKIWKEEIAAQRALKRQDKSVVREAESFLASNLVIDSQTVRV